MGNLGKYNDIDNSTLYGIIKSRPNRRRDIKKFDDGAGKETLTPGLFHGKEAL